MAMNDWGLMRVVLAVARNQGVSGAAKDLSVNQATISRHIAKAEEEMKVRLFDRLTSGMKPTKEGLAVVAVAERLEREIGSLDATISEMSDSIGGMIRMSVPTSLMAYGLAEEIAAFSVLYPNVTFQIIGEDDIVSVGERRADIVIRAQAKPADGLWGYRLGEAEIRYFATAELREKWSDALMGRAPDAAIPLIDISILPPSIESEFKRSYPNAVKTVMCRTLDEYLPLLRQGMGFGLCPCFIAASCPELVFCPEIPCTRTRPIWALTHPDLKDVPLYRTLMDFLNERFKERSDQFDAPLVI